MQNVAACPRKILVADEISDVGELLTMMFKNEGHEVYAAHDGETAYSLAELHWPDVVVTDLRLPKLSGIALAQKIRANSKFDSTVLVAHTGSPSLTEQAAEAGFDYFALKPVEGEILVGTTYAARQDQLILLSLSLLERSEAIQSRANALSDRAHLARMRSKFIIESMKARRYGRWTL